MPALAGETFTMEQYISALDAKQDELTNLPFGLDLEEQVKGIVYACVADNFIFTTDSGGNLWPEHSPVTVALYGEHPLLILSGTMHAAATQSGAPGNFESVSATGIVFGVDLIYAATQQFGDSRRNIPQREFFYITDEAIGQIEDVTYQYAAEKAA